jgi:hypothetical protein
MKRIHQRLVVGLATIALAAVAVGAAAAATVTANLFAHAGPVTMHADLAVPTLHPAGVSTTGVLSGCYVQPVSKPRSGIADKLVCTTRGHRVVMPVAGTSATLNYRLRNTSRRGLSSMTVQIRHNGFVLFTLTSRTGSLTVPLTHTPGLLNGQDTLYVRTGTHTYRSTITQVR